MSIDHSRPIPPDASVRRSRLARLLNVPSLFTKDGQLYRIVCVWRGRLGDLVWQAEDRGLIVEPAREFAGLAGRLRSCEGVVFLPVSGVVLCGAAEDLAETLETEGRLDLILESCGGPRVKALDGGPAAARRRALPAPDGPEEQGEP